MAPRARDRADALLRWRLVHGPLGRDGLCEPRLRRLHASRLTAGVPPGGCSVGRAGEPRGRGSPGRRLPHRAADDPQRRGRPAGRRSGGGCPRGFTSTSTTRTSSTSGAARSSRRRCARSAPASRRARLRRRRPRSPSAHRVWPGRRSRGVRPGCHGSTIRTCRPRRPRQSARRPRRPGRARARSPTSAEPARTSCAGPRG